MGIDGVSVGARGAAGCETRAAVGYGAEGGAACGVEFCKSCEDGGAVTCSSLTPMKISFFIKPALIMAISASDFGMASAAVSSSGL